MDDRRAAARNLAAKYLAKNDPLGWFDAFYQDAAGEAANIAWANLQPNPKLIEWLHENSRGGVARRALVIGCGLGDDAEALVEQGWRVTAFDISSTAVAWCRRRFPESSVCYEVADLLASPSKYSRAFEFVFEANTLPVLPKNLRGEAMKNAAQCVAIGGTLMLIARGREPSDPEGSMPWPLTIEELAQFERNGLRQSHFQDYLDDEVPPVRRFLALYRRNA